MKLSNIDFDELCNTLEKHYASYRNRQLGYGDGAVFAVNPPSNSKFAYSLYIFLTFNRFNKEFTKEITIYDPVYNLVEEPYFGCSTHNIHLADVSDQEDIINSVISKIDNNLKTYYDMKKQFLKNKMDKL